MEHEQSTVGERVGKELQRRHFHGEQLQVEIVDIGEDSGVVDFYVDFYVGEPINEEFRKIYAYTDEDDTSDEFVRILKYLGYNYLNFQEHVIGERVPAVYGDSGWRIDLDAEDFEDPPTLSERIGERVGYASDLIKPEWKSAAVGIVAPLYPFFILPVWAEMFYKFQQDDIGDEFGSIANAVVAAFVVGALLVGWVALLFVLMLVDTATFDLVWSGTPGNPQSITGPYMNG